MHEINDMNFNTQRPHVVECIEESHTIIGTWSFKAFVQSVEKYCRLSTSDTNPRIQSNWALFSANSNRLAP